MRFSFITELSKAIHAHARRGALALLLFSFATPCARSQHWELTNGPSHDYVLSLFAIGDTVYAGALNGIVVTTNEGASWRNVDSIYNGQVGAFAKERGWLFAGGPFGIDRSGDNGQTWSSAYRFGPVYNSGILSLAVGGSIIYAGTFYYGVLGSTDDGASWKYLGLPQQCVTALTIVGTEMFAGTYGGGVFRSTDGGLSWTALNAGITNTNVYSLVEAGSLLFAGTYGGGVFRSTDSGASWSATNAGLNSLLVRTLYVTGSNLLAGTDSGIWLSTDSGSSWSGYSAGMYPWQGNLLINSFVFDGQYLFAGMPGYGSLGSSVWRTSMPRPGSIALALDPFPTPMCLHGATLLHFANNSADSITIDSASASAPFTIASQLPMPVAGGVSSRIQVDVADSGGTVVGSVHIFYHKKDGTAHDTTMPVSATAVQPVKLLLGMGPLAAHASDSLWYDLPIYFDSTLDSATAMQLGMRTITITLHLNTNLLTPGAIIAGDSGVTIGPTVSGGDSVSFTVTLPSAEFLLRSKGILAIVSLQHFATDTLSTKISLTSPSITTAAVTPCYALILPEPIVFTNPRCGDREIMGAMSGNMLFRIVSVQPNPAQSEIEVRVVGTDPGASPGGEVATLHAEMYDALGRAILPGQDVRGTSLHNVFSLDVSGVPEGEYYLRLIGTSGVASRRVVILR